MRRARLPLGTLLRAPAFWDTRGPLSDAVLPLSAAYAAASRLHEALSGTPARARAPVVCVGSALVGGACKTPTVLAIAERLAARRPALRVHVLTRGYGGTERGPLRVRPAEHGACAVGDEALLLAAAAPTWVGAARHEAATAACAAGAQLLLMDDGLQHHGLQRDLSLLCLDEAYLLGNGRVLPAGPLREPFGRALARSDAVVCVRQPAGGGARTDAELRAALRLPPATPLLRAALEPDKAAAAALAGERVVAFSGTARPERFFDTLRGLGCVMARAPTPLPDHAPLGAELLARLRGQAAEEGALLATTCKDAARLPAAERAVVHTLPVRLRWLGGAAAILDALIDAALEAGRAAAGENPHEAPPRPYPKPYRRVSIERRLRL